MRDAKIIDQLRQAGAVIAGSNIEISCLLYFSDRNCFLSLREHEFSIDVTDMTLETRLLETVPCNLGGQYLYQDTVIIQGIFEHSESGIEITRIEHGELHRDGELFKF
jgi:hypothetical protein